MSDLTPDEGTEWLAAIKAADANCWRGHPQMLREAEQHRRILLAHIAELERSLSLANDANGTIEAALLDARRENAELREQCDELAGQVEVHDRKELYRNAHEPKEQQQPRLTVDGMDSTEALQVADSHDRAGYLSDWQKALIVLAANYRSLVKRFEHACKEVTRLSNPHETRDFSMGRTHEQCFDCALQDVEPAQCRGHAAGPVNCPDFRAQPLNTKDLLTGENNV